MDLFLQSVGNCGGFVRVGRSGLAFLLALMVWVTGTRFAVAADQTRPNVVVILSDDVGYGDIGCYGAKRVSTPNIDRLAGGGLRFTDAHSSASTCTPSRYSIMTGQYAWRKKGTGVLPGNAPLIIPVGSTTLPGEFHQAGYTTAAIGKWHLGLGDGHLDWNGEIKPGPLEIGFDYCFIIPATGDRVPCVFIENHRIVGLDPTDPVAVSYGIKVGDEPTGKDHPELLKMKLSEGHDGTIINGISRIGFMAGGKSARWKDGEIAIDLTQQATAFIEQNQTRPFFLYFATHDIHVPRVPNKMFAGTSQCGVRGDAIEELDWSVGRVIDTLNRLNLANNTLVIFSSDNGPIVDDGYADGSVQALGDHKPAGPWRGGKYSIYEGGTRLPLITSWPGTIQPGTSDALLGQVDLLAAMADLLKQKGPTNTDSLDVLPALLGKNRQARLALIEESNGIAVRQGNWKLIPPYRGVNLMTRDEEGRPRKARGEGAMDVPQLFDLNTDPGETTNVAKQHPQTVADLTRCLQQQRDRIP